MAADMLTTSPRSSDSNITPERIELLAGQLTGKTTDAIAEIERINRQSSLLALTPLTADEKRKSRVCIVDKTGQIIADTHSNLN